VSSQFDSTGMYPFTLGNSKVTFNGMPAPLTYVSTTQINAMVPYGVSGSAQVDVVVEHGGVKSAAFGVAVMDTAAGLLTATGTGNGQGSILNFDGRVNAAENPSEKGRAITIFATGSGIWSESVPDGRIFVVATRPPAAAVSLTVGGQPARILYAGGAPFQPPGVIQVNAVVPVDVGSGPQPVVLTVGQSSSAQQQVTVAVQ
jgi:uncharacterized protein (TIGR03437 family)